MWCGRQLERLKVVKTKRPRRYARSQETGLDVRGREAPPGAADPDPLTEAPPASVALRVVRSDADIAVASALLDEIEAYLHRLLDEAELEAHGAEVVESEILPRVDELRGLITKTAQTDSERGGLIRLAHRILGGVGASGRHLRRAGDAVTPGSAVATVPIFAQGDEVVGT